MTKPLAELLKELEDPNIVVKAEAAKAFAGRRKHPAATAALCRLLREGQDIETRYWAAYALCCTADERSTDCLLAALADRNEAPKVRGQAAEALGRIFVFGGQSPAIVPLILALSDSEPEVRFWSAFALGQIRARQALPMLKRLAATDDATVPDWWSVKKEAADAVSTILYGPTAAWPGHEANRAAADQS